MFNNRLTQYCKSVGVSSTCSPTKASIPGPMVDIGVLSTETDADLTRCTTSFMAETDGRINFIFVLLILLWRRERKMNRVMITDEKVGGIVRCCNMLRSW